MLAHHRKQDRSASTVRELVSVFGTIQHDTLQRIGPPHRILRTIADHHFGIEQADLERFNGKGGHRDRMDHQRRGGLSGTLRHTT